MGYKKIDSLLKKYYNGETSLEEENLIRDFFANENSSNEFQREKELFDSYQKIALESEPDDNLNNELLDLIDTSWANSTRNRFRSVVKWSVSAAASIIIGVSMYFYFQPKPKIVDTYTDEQQAYEATIEVLTYISKTMNSESVKLASLAQINENFKNIDKLENLEKAIKNYKSKDE